MGDHVQDAGVRASHQHRKSTLDLQCHADLVTKIIRDKAIFRPAYKPGRDFFKIMDPRENGNQVNSGKNLLQAADFMVIHTVFPEKIRAKAGGEVRIADTVHSVLGFKEMGTGIKLRTSQIVFRQIPEAGRMVIVTVADDHRIQILQIHAKPMGVILGIGTAAAVKEDPAAVVLYIERQAMLGNKGLVLRGLVVHQGCDM